MSERVYYRNVWETGGPVGSLQCEKLTVFGVSHPG